MVIHWPILSEICHGIVVQNLSYYIFIAWRSSVPSRGDVVDLPVLCVHVSYHGKKVVCCVATLWEVVPLSCAVITYHTQ